MVVVGIADVRGGARSYTLGATAAQAAAVQALAGDAVVHDTFAYTATDGLNKSNSATLDITVNGSNDVIYTVNDTVDPSATKLGAGTQLIVGSGIPASGFGIATQTDVGVELGLQVIYRQGPTVLTTDDYADGVLHYRVASGAQSVDNGSFANNANRAAWSFEYSIATGLGGKPGNLDSYTFQLKYDVDPTAGVSYRTLELEPGGLGSSSHQWRDLGSGQVFIADDAGNGNVTQNSENYAFSFFQSFLTSAYGPGSSFGGPGHFDIVLEASRSGQLLAENHIVVDVNGVRLFAADHTTLVATFNTIQAAVDAAGVGYLIDIPEGIYQEQVTITNKTLTIHGAGDATQILAPTSLVANVADPGPTGTPSKNALIGVSGGHVDISGLKIDGAGNANHVSTTYGAADYNGIFFLNAGGSIDDVTVVGIHDPYNLDGSLNGTQRGNAIVVANRDGNPTPLKAYGSWNLGADRPSQSRSGASQSSRRLPALQPLFSRGTEKG